MPPKKKAEPRKGKTLQRHNAKMHKLVKPKKQAKPKTETAPKKVSSKKTPTGSTINFYFGTDQGGNRNVSYSEFKQGMHRPTESIQSRTNAQRQQLPDGYVLVERAPTASATPATTGTRSFSNAGTTHDVKRDLDRPPMIEDVDDAPRQTIISTTPATTRTRSPELTNKIAMRMRERSNLRAAAQNAPLTNEQINNMRSSQVERFGNSITSGDSSGDRVRFAESHFNHRFNHASRPTPSEIGRIVEFVESQIPRTAAGRAAYERDAGMYSVGIHNPTEGTGLVSIPTQPPLTGIHTFTDSVGVDRSTM